MRILHDGSQVADDAPVRALDGRLYRLTPAETAAREAEVVEALGRRPLRDWQAQIADSDRLLGPRQFEDLVLALKRKGVLVPADLPAELDATLALRADLRARRPAE